MKTIRIKDTGVFDSFTMATVALNCAFPRKPKIEFQTRVLTAGALTEVELPHNKEGQVRRIVVAGMTNHGTAVAVVTFVKEKGGSDEVPVSICVGVKNQGVEFRIEVQ